MINSVFEKTLCFEYLHLINIITQITVAVVRVILLHI